MTFDTVWDCDMSDIYLWVDVLKAEELHRKLWKKWMLPGGVKSLINENVKNARRSGTSVMGHDSSRERAKNIKS